MGKNDALLASAVADADAAMMRVVDHLREMGDDYWRTVSHAQSVLARLQDDVEAEKADHQSGKFVVVVMVGKDMTGVIGPFPSEAEAEGWAAKKSETIGWGNAVYHIEDLVPSANMEEEEETTA